MISSAEDVDLLSHDAWQTKTLRCFSLVIALR